MSRKGRFIIMIKKLALLIGVLFWGFLTYAQTPEVISGRLVKKDWSKTIESYCAGGSDYYLLLQKGKRKTIVDISGIEDKTVIDRALRVRRVSLTGKTEIFTKAPADPMSQQPVSPPSCVIFRTQKISIKK